MHRPERRFRPLWRWVVMLPFLVFCLFALVVFFALQRGPQAQKVAPLPLELRHLPPFAFPLLTRGDRIFSLQDTQTHNELTPKTLEGHITLLVFWAPWCGDCIKEHGVLLKIAQQEKAHGVQLVGVVCRSEPEAGQRFVLHYGNPFATLAYNPSGGTVKGAPIDVPQFFVLNEKGAIYLHGKGPLNESFYRKRLAPLFTQLYDGVKTPPEKQS